MIRELDEDESYLLDAIYAKVFARSFRLKTKRHDLFMNIDLLKKAILEWMSIHPFLNVKVAENPCDRSTKYFVKLDQEEKFKLNELKNVSFLKLKCDEDHIDSLSFDEAAFFYVQKDVNEEIDHLNQPLWRLTFIQKNPFEYEVVLTIKHSISEGRNSHAILLQLVKLIEAHFVHERSLIADGNHEMSSYDPLPPISKLYVDPSITKLYIPQPDLPSFIRLNKNNLIDSHFKSGANLTLIDTEANEADKGRCLKIADLIALSSNNLSKFRRIKLNETLVSKLVVKCKQERCKFTSFMNILFCYAFDELYRAHEGHDSNVPLKFIYMDAISARQFEPVGAQQPPPPTHEMGMFILGLDSSIQIVRRSDSIINDFWNHAREDSKQFHERVSNREMFGMQVHPKDDHVDSMRPFTHFGISNLGQLDSKLNTDEFEIADGNFNMQLGDTRKRLLFILMSTVNNQCNISVVFNSQLFSSELYAEIEKNVFSLLSKLVD